jgi:hypothetical protein
MRRPRSFGKAPQIPKEGICGPPAQSNIEAVNEWIERNKKEEYNVVKPQSNHKLFHGGGRFKRLAAR